MELQELVERIQKWKERTASNDSTDLAPEQTADEIIEESAALASDKFSAPSIDPDEEIEESTDEPMDYVETSATNDLEIDDDEMDSVSDEDDEDDELSIGEEDQTHQELEDETGEIELEDAEELAPNEPNRGN